MLIEIASLTVLKRPKKKLIEAAVTVKEMTDWKLGTQKNHGLAKEVESTWICRT